MKLNEFRDGLKVQVLSASTLRKLIKRKDWNPRGMFNDTILGLAGRTGTVDLSYSSQSVKIDEWHVPYYMLKKAPK
jgi:hypothetical protein